MNDDNVMDTKRFDELYGENRFLELLYEGNALYNKGEHDKAINCYTKAIEISPNNAKGYNLRGGAKYDLGDIKGAIIDYNRVLEIDPDNKIICYYLGVAERELNEEGTK